MVNFWYNLIWHSSFCTLGTLHPQNNVSRIFKNPKYDHVIYVILWRWSEHYFCQNLFFTDGLEAERIFLTRADPVEHTFLRINPNHNYLRPTHYNQVIMIILKTLTNSDRDTEGPKILNWSTWPLFFILITYELSRLLYIIERTNLLLYPA